MKFAVIEYTSKTGHIWKHTTQRPNYLADPTKEIDPTSFGGYVSALSGEHIPITHLIKPNFLKKVIKRLTKSWPPGYNISYLKQFDTLLVVHQLDNAHEIAAFTKRLKKKYPHIFILGVPTQPYGLLKPIIDSDKNAKVAFKNFMDACDIFMVVVDSTKEWYQSITSTPVIYFPQIYPVHYAKKFFKPAQAKQSEIFIAGVTSRPNIKQGQIVAAALQKKFPKYIINITDIEGMDYDTTNLKNAKYKVIPFQQWRQHLPTLASHKLVINTDYTLTRGRVQVDSAAVGTPSLGGNSDGQTDLFPKLATTPQTPTDTIIKLGAQLLQDQTYYDQIVDHASTRLQKYDYEESAARLQMLVKSHHQDQTINT